MTRYLCISVTLLDPLFHGKADHDKPEWPPSPLRLFQAVLRGARTGSRESQWTRAKAAAFEWLERCEPPVIVAPCALLSRSSHTLFVPNNDSDKECDQRNRLTSKVARPYHLPEDIEDRRLHYLWRINEEDNSSALDYAELLCAESRHLLALGWGIDQAVATGHILPQDEAEAFVRKGVKWRPFHGHQYAADTRRVPRQGTFCNLEMVYESFVNRVNGRRYTPPLKPSVFGRTRYVCPDFIPSRPYAVFELRHDDGEYCRYSQRKLIHVAGMVRHLARQTMLSDPPPGVADHWIERYIAGHRPEGETDHRQLSYLPLPSIGHEHADQIVRRVMIAAPVGDDAWLEHVAHRLAGQRLQSDPERGADFGDAGLPMLARVSRDNISRHYMGPAKRWASVTPVILPGHDDRKPYKTRKLIEAALAQSDIEQPCEFEWSAHSLFRKSFSAHKYDQDRKPIGYIRPDHLLTQTAVHLKLQFSHDLRIPGPLAIGAGRHCGFGLMAAAEK